MPYQYTNNDNQVLSYRYDSIDGSWKGMNGNNEFFNRAFLYGDGYFDTIAIHAGEIQWPDAHQAKNREAALRLGFSYNENVWKHLLEASFWLLPSASLRVYWVVPGTIGTGDVSASLDGYATVTVSRDQKKYLAVKADYIQDAVYSKSSLFTVKTLCRLPFLEAIRLAHKQSATEAIMLNEYGRIACLSSSSIVYGYASNAYVIPASEGCMHGAARRVWLKYYKDTDCYRALDSSDVVLGNMWMIGINSLGFRVLKQIGESLMANPPAYVVEILKKMYPFLDFASLDSQAF